MYGQPDSAAKWRASYPWHARIIGLPSLDIMSSGTIEMTASDGFFRESITQAASRVKLEPFRGDHVARVNYSRLTWLVWKLELYSSCVLVWWRSDTKMVLFPPMSHATTTVPG